MHNLYILAIVFYNHKTFFIFTYGCHTWFFRPVEKKPDESNRGVDVCINKQWYVSDDVCPHDIFRIGTYPTKKLWSVEECLKFIEKNKDKVYRGDLWHGNQHDPSIDLVEVTLKLIEAFEKFPGGFIEFG